MKKASFFIILLTCLIVNSGCSKEKNTYGVSGKVYLTTKYISNKIWTLNYLKFGDSLTKSYIGANAYYIIFYNDNTCKDFDGVTGSYSVAEKNDSLWLEINGKTLRGNPVLSYYSIDHIGPNTLYLSYKNNESMVVTQVFTVKN